MIVLSIAAAVLAAALGFLVEPMVGKFLLPAYGGSAGVWTTALVFFQAALLAGYAIAHALRRQIGTRLWAPIQVALVCAPLLALPVGLPRAAAPPAGTEPALWLLGILAVMIAAPLVALATTTPTVQAWLAGVGGLDVQSNAFRLFAASNAGSLLGLLVYPTIVEPNLDLVDQSRLWSYGYVAFVALIAILATVVWRRSSTTSHRDVRRQGEAEPLISTGPSARTRLAWLGYAAIPAALVIGTTAHLSTDVAAVPLLWVVPLAIYLITIVLSFAGAQPIGLRVANALLPLLAVGVLLGELGIGSVPLWFVFATDLGALAAAGIVVHGRLALARPGPDRLTEYDLAIAAGGALGGLLTGILAPLLLPIPIEGAIALVIALALRFGPADATAAGAQTTGSSRSLGRWERLAAILRGIPRAVWYLIGVGLVLGLVGVARVDLPPALLIGAFVLGLLLVIADQPIPFAVAILGLLGLSVVLLPPSLETVRTFYGVRRVVDDGSGRHALFSGTTVQGIQRLEPAELRDEPIGYYHRGGPIADVVATAQARVSAARLAVVGLGAGAMAAFGRPADTITFYEIDPEVVNIARDRRLFTYVSDARAHVDVVTGDGRLGVGLAPPESFDLLVIDAFSSDAVPVHLLTEEAISEYLDHLGAGGLLAFNISNRYVLLEPVLSAAVSDLGLTALARIDEPPAEAGDADSSHWVVIARDPADVGGLVALPGWRSLVPPIPRAWTDRYSDLLGVLNLR